MLLKLKASHLSYKYEDSDVNILEDINFEIFSGSRVGLIGSNGCGKTTLLKIICEKIILDKKCLQKLNDIKIAYLAQEQIFDDKLTVLQFFLHKDLLEIKIKMESINEESELYGELIGQYSDLGGYEVEYKIEKLLHKHNIPIEYANKILANFSGGEKTRFALLKLLLSSPDFLILDEPTNHLDQEQLDWLEQFLNNFKGSCLIVSHDRYFLDRCITQIWELKDKRVIEFTGNYSFYKKNIMEEEARKIKEYQNAQKKIKILTKSKSGMKKWAGSHQAQTGANGGGAIYESATNSAAKSYKRFKTMEHRIDKIIDETNENKPFIEKKRKVKLENRVNMKSQILDIEDLQIDYGNFLIPSKPFNLTLNQNDRANIKGINGSGKSSIFKAILGLLPNEIIKGKIKKSPSVKILYYAQELEILQQTNSIIDELKRIIENNGYEFIETEVRNLLGCFNIKHDNVFKKIEKLSPGEKSKVALIAILLQPADLLILDEPTNHLEIVARESFEEALLNYNGTILFVSHDRFFTDKISNKTVNI